MKNHKIRDTGTIHSDQWKEQAEEMTKFFNQNCFPIFYRIQRLYIDEAYRICKEKDIHNISYFWGCIKHHKKRNKLNQEL